MDSLFIFLCLLDNVITKFLNQNSLFMGLGLRDFNYEMLLKLGDEVFPKKRGPQKGGRFKKEEIIPLYRLWVEGPIKYYPNYKGHNYRKPKDCLELVLKFQLRG